MGQHIKKFERQDLVHREPFGHIQVKVGTNAETSSVTTVSEVYEKNVSIEELQAIVHASVDPTKDLPRGWKQTYGK